MEGIEVEDHSESRHTGTAAVNGAAAMYLEQ